MNKIVSDLPLGATAPLAEILLADTAIKVELPPSQHMIAIERYEAVRTYIEREGSLLRGLVALFYPQGSMAISATIRAKRRDDGYDIDIIAELLLAIGTPPAVVLDLLFKALRGEPGSRYYDMVKRQTRCVTIYYADGMHLDVTPSILVNEQDPRRSNIFHAKPGAPHEDKTLEMNSHAFARHFRDLTPVDFLFASAYAKRAWLADAALAKAEAEEVPPHSSELGGKSTSVVALQLLKRNRNILYQPRTSLRMPPSAMMSCLTAEVAVPGRSIGAALVVISTHILTSLEQAQAAGKLVDVRNPKCSSERFTDRWPENLAAQDLYIRDLRRFQGQLAELMDPARSLKEKGDLLAAMFGEQPARDVIRDYNLRIGQSVQSGQRLIGAGGGVLVGAPAVAKAPAVKPHTFYGTRWPSR